MAVWPAAPQPSTQANKRVPNQPEGTDERLGSVMGLWQCPSNELARRCGGVSVAIQVLLWQGVRRDRPDVNPASRQHAVSTSGVLPARVSTSAPHSCSSSRVLLVTLARQVGDHTRFSVVVL
jgi:hypothetical protein